MESLLTRTLTKKQLNDKFKRLQDTFYMYHTMSATGIDILEHYFIEERLNTRTIQNKLSPLEYLTKNEEQALKYQTAYNCSLKSLLGLKCSPCYHFRPAVAKWVSTMDNYNRPLESMGFSKYTMILDPFIGWGGRFLGAMSAPNIKKYIGFDTNLNLQSGYNQMIADLEIPQERYQLIWSNCLDFDYSTVKYDLVFTSPPFVNECGELVEKYNYCPQYNDFYGEFYQPLLNKLFKGLEIGGRIALHLPGNMLEKTIEILGPPFESCEYKKRQCAIRNKEIKKELIYFWDKLEN